MRDEKILIPKEEGETKWILPHAFKKLNSIDVNEYTREKNGLTYLSWSKAWELAKKEFPDASFEVRHVETELGPRNYFTDGKTCWVEVSVTISGETQTESLPVMNYKNQSVGFDSVTSTDVNKAIKRCLTKCLGLFGLGLYIYNGEDIPEDAYLCEDCQQPIKAVGQVSVFALAQATRSKYGCMLCKSCADKRRAKAEQEGGK